MSVAVKQKSDDIIAPLLSIAGSLGTAVAVVISFISTYKSV